MRDAPQEMDSRAAESAGSQTAAIVFEDVYLSFDEKVILKGVSFVLEPGHMKIILGASGAGKSTTLRLILGLLKPDSGRIWVNGRRVDGLSEAEMLEVRSDLGMVFQEGALFDSFTVQENAGYRLYEETDMSIEDVDARVEEVLGFVGLAEMSDRMPAELSGGQRRRVAIARAMASRPKILLYDEPTTGLDPITALSVDEELVKLRDLEGVSSILVTHQLRDAFHVATHMAERSGGTVKLVPASAERLEMTEFIMLKEGRVVFEGPADTLRRTSDDYLRAFLS